MSKEIERIIGPCSKHVSGEGWVTEVPVAQLFEKGYAKERVTIWNEWYDQNLKPIWICENCNSNYMKVNWSKPYKYCPSCGARIVEYKTLDYKENK